MIPSPSEVGAEEIIGNLVLWLKLAVETIGALVIGLGMLLAAGRFVAGFPPAVLTFADVRLTLARFLAIALEFQLGADILSTAVAPTWDAIGKLAAVAIIRTALNYFLSRDMQDHRTSQAESPDGGTWLDLLSRWSRQQMRAGSGASHPARPGQRSRLLRTH